MKLMRNISILIILSIKKDDYHWISKDK
jgi:hypothetical protein